MMKMKELAAKFLNANGYFPEETVKAELFDDDNSVAFKNYYPLTCLANDKIVQVQLKYNANTKVILMVTSNYNVFITFNYVDPNQELNDEVKRSISLKLNSIAHEILASALAD